MRATPALAVMLRLALIHIYLSGVKLGSSHERMAPQKVLRHYRNKADTLLGQPKNHAHFSKSAVGSNHKPRDRLLASSINKYVDELLYIEGL